MLTLFYLYKTNQMFITSFISSPLPNSNKSLHKRIDKHTLTCRLADKGRDFVQRVQHAEQSG